MDGLTY